VVILLGTHFMFTEELGSRLRGEGFTVHPFDNVDDLRQRLDRENYNVELVILDLQHEPAGGLSSLKLIKSRGIPVLAISEHKKTDVMQEARELGTDRVIINSQASKNIEKYVHELLS